MSAAKIAISLPEPLLVLLEEARRLSGQTRSEFIARAVEAFLLASRTRAEAEAYAQGYERFPETAEEVREADRLGAAILALEPWD